MERMFHSDYWRTNGAGYSDTIADVCATYDLSTRYTVTESDRVMIITDNVTKATIVSPPDGINEKSRYTNAISLLIAPPTQRHIFEDTVHAYLLRDTSYARVYTHSNAQQIARIASNTPEMSLSQLPLRVGIPKNVNKALDAVHTTMSILATHVTRHIHELAPSPLLKDPMIRARVWAYSHFGRSIPNILRDGIEGQLELTHVALNSLVRQIYIHRPDMGFHSQSPQDIFTSLVGIMRSDEFKHALIALTPAPNGFLFPNVREHPESFNVWDVNHEPVRILPSYIQKMRKLLQDHNERVESLSADGVTVYRNSVDDQTSSGCPAAKKGFTSCYDPFDVRYLPVDEYDIQRVKKIHPIFLLHEFACTTLEAVRIPYQPSL